MSSTPNLIAQPAEVRLVLSIHRATTGVTEQIELIGQVLPTNINQPPEDSRDVGDPFDRSTQRGN